MKLKKIDDSKKKYSHLTRLNYKLYLKKKKLNKTNQTLYVNID